jgi:hypothetical protein
LFNDIILFSKNEAENEMIDLQNIFILDVDKEITNSELKIRIGRREKGIVTHSEYQFETEYIKNEWISSIKTSIGERSKMIK